MNTVLMKKQSYNLYWVSPNNAGTTSIYDHDLTIAGKAALEGMTVAEPKPIYFTNGAFTFHCNMVKVERMEGIAAGYRLTYTNKG